MSLEKVLFGGVVIAGLSLGAWALLKGHKYAKGDTLQLDDLATTYRVEDIIHVEDTDWYVLNDGSGAFRVEVAVVDKSPLWHKVA